MSDATSDVLITEMEDAEDIKARMELAAARLALHAEKKRVLSGLEKEIAAIEQVLRRDSKELNEVMMKLAMETVVVGDLMAKIEAWPDFRTFFTRVHNLSLEF